MNDLLYQIPLYAASLWRKRWYIVAVGYVICLSGWATIAMLPDRFESKARIYVDTDSILSPLLRGISVEGNVAQQVDYMRQTILSRPNIEKLIKMTDLDLRLGTPESKEQFIAAVVRRISVSGGGRNIFNMSFHDRNPEVAQQVVQSLLSIFVESNVGSARSDIEKARLFIEGQVSRYEQDLRAAEAKLADYKKTHATFLGSTSSTFTQRLEEKRAESRVLSIQLDDARSRRAALQQGLDRTQEFREIEARDPIVIAMGSEAVSPALQSLLGRIEEAGKAIDALLLRYTDQHPDVIAAQRRLLALNELLAQERQNGAPAPPPRRGAVAAPLKKQSIPNPVYEQIRLRLVEADGNVQSLENRVANHQDELARLEAQMARAPAVEAEFANLNRDYAVLKKSFDELIARRESARIADAVEANGDKMQFRIVDPPQVPTLPSGPPRLLLMAVVLAAALIGGVAFAFVMSQLDRSFLLLRDLKESVRVPVLGSVTLLQSPGERRLARLGALSFATSMAMLVIAFGCLALLSLRAPISSFI